MVDVHENYYFEIFHSSKKKKKKKMGISMKNRSHHQYVNYIDVILMLQMI